MTASTNSRISTVDRAPAGPSLGPGRCARRVLAVAALGIVAGGALVGCGASVPGAKAKDSGQATTSTAVSTTVPSDTMGSSLVATTAPIGQTPSTEASGGGGTGTGTGTGVGTPSPTIATFDTPESIDCHNGNFQTFTAIWTTQGATKTTISIDGPGVYDTYGPNDSASLPFNCSTPHTFLLTAYDADGHTANKEITLQPRNVQQEGMEQTDSQ